MADCWCSRGRRSATRRRLARGCAPSSPAPTSSPPRTPAGTRRLAADLGVTIARPGRLLLRAATSAQRPPELVAALDGGPAGRCSSPTPACRAVSDPGYRLVAAAVEAGHAGDRRARARRAVLTALARRGLPVDRFCFEGFLPRKAGERAARARARSRPSRARWCSSRRRTASRRRSPRWPRRSAPTGRAAVCRELTKTYEEVRRGALAELAAWAADGRARRDHRRRSQGAARRRARPVERPTRTLVRAGARAARRRGTRRKEAIAEVAADAGRRRREVYEAASPPRTRESVPRARRPLGLARMSGSRRRPSTSRRRSTTSTTPRTSATRTRRWPATCSPAGTGSAASDIWFLTGTDEHGQKIMRTAEANGVDAAGVGRPAGRRRPGSRCSRRSTSPTTTSSAPPSRATTSGVQEFLQALYDAGESTRAQYEGPYCVGCEEFKLPGDLARRRRATYAGQKVLPDPRPPGRAAVSESNYFFQLSAYPTGCSSYYEAQPDFVQPAVGAQRGRLVRPAGPAGPLDLAVDLRLGHPGAVGPEPRHLRLVRRAAQLRHRRRARRRADDPATSSSRDAGPPTCTSSARTSCASTRSSGRRC